MSKPTMCQVSGRKRNQHDLYREEGRSLLLNGTESLWELSGNRVGGNSGCPERQKWNGLWGTALNSWRKERYSENGTREQFTWEPCSGSLVPSRVDICTHPHPHPCTPIYSEGHRDRSFACLWNSYGQAKSSRKIITECDNGYFQRQKQSNNTQLWFPGEI